MRAKPLALAGCVLALMGALLLAKPDAPSETGDGLVAAARAFRGSLSPQQLMQASFAYDDPERLNWHFIPRERKGLPLKSLEGEPLRAAHRLIAAGLSEAGYDQSLNVMSLEELLYLLEGGEREKRRAKRDPLKYYLSLFGEPTPSGTWGYRVEGHHLSLNYTVKAGKIVASTPEFFGANPGSVAAGPGRRIRVLGPEEDIARQLLKTCSPEQQQVAWIDRKPPGEVRTPGEAQPATAAAVGLVAAKMTADQKKLLAELLSEYLKNMPAEVERERRARIDAAGIDGIHFAWWGGSELDEPHHYVVQGPTFVVEYNNTQNDANHVHSMWRNLAGDFDVPIKK